MDEMEASSPSSRGPEILSNPVIIESILPALDHLNDILSFSLVSRQTYLLVNPLHPLSARKISLVGLERVNNKHVIDFLYRSLKTDEVNTRRRLLEDGRTVTVSGGFEKGYVGAWRFLASIDLSGTSVTTKFVKLLIAASAGGKIPGLLGDKSTDAVSSSDSEVEVYTGARNGLFAKEFGFMSVGAYRLLNDQSLRLERLCVTNCPGVDITEINSFLKKILIVVTAPRRRELRSRATQQLAAAQQGAAANPNNHPIFGANLQFVPPQPQHQAQPQTAAQQQTEDLNTVPSPLPSTVEELAEFGLPCMSLRRLEVANVKNLYVDPPEKYRGKKEWGYSKECPYGRNVGGLNSIAGCLGIDVDVLFCQGAGCATSFDHSRWRLSNNEGEDSYIAYDDDFDIADRNTPHRRSGSSRASGRNANSAQGPGEGSRRNSASRNTRKTYHYPLPRLPGERILMMDDGRVFRIPRHAIPTPATPAQQAQNLANAPFQALNPGVAPGLHQPNNQGGNHGGNNGGHGTASHGWAASAFLQDPAQYGLGVVGAGISNTTTPVNMATNAGAASTQTMAAAGLFGIGGAGGAGMAGNPPPTQFHAPLNPFHPLNYFHHPIVGNPVASVPSAASTAAAAGIQPAGGNASAQQSLNDLLATISGVQTPPSPSAPSYPATNLPSVTDPAPEAGSSSSGSVGVAVGETSGALPATHSGDIAQLSQPQSPPAVVAQPPQQQGNIQAPLLGAFIHNNIPPPDLPPLMQPPLVQQTHNQNQPAPGIGLSLGPRRRNNSPGGRTGSGSTLGRPGRRIAMLDGPRGLCEGCAREVWLCESCNRYWVVTCGGCAGRG